MYAPSQWEMALHCNTVSHWLGAAYTEWSLLVTMFEVELGIAHNIYCISILNNKQHQKKYTGNLAGMVIVIYCNTDKKIITAAITMIWLLHGQYRRSISVGGTQEDVLPQLWWETSLSVWSLWISILNSFYSTLKLHTQTPTACESLVEGASRPISK